LSKELDEMMLGVTLDRQTNSGYMDLEFTAIPGTNMAAPIGGLQTGQDRFCRASNPRRSHYFQCHVYFNRRGRRPRQKIHRSHPRLGPGRTKGTGPFQEQLDLAADVLNQLFDLAIKTIELKKSDYGMAVVLEPKRLDRGRRLCRGRWSETRRNP